MTHMPSLRSILEMPDRCNIQATKPRNINPAAGRRYSDEMNRFERTSSECDDSSSQKSFGDFDAIPEEFRPTKRGRDLLKVRSSANKDVSNVKMNTQEPHRHERYPVKPNVSQHNGRIADCNSFPAQNESWNYKKEPLKSEKSEKPFWNSDLLEDETEKQKKVSGMFFHDDSSENTLASRPSRERLPYLSGKENNQSEWSGRLDLKNIQDEKSPNKFFLSNSCQSKARKKTDSDSSVTQKKDEASCPKLKKNAPPKFQNQPASTQNKALFEETEARKITRETTVTKRIQWKNDLCRFKKPENEQKVLYEYTKTTKEYVSRVEDDESPKRFHHGFERKLHRAFSERLQNGPKFSERNQNDPKYSERTQNDPKYSESNQKDSKHSDHHQSDIKRPPSKGFNSTNKTPMREARNWAPRRPPNTYQGRRNCFHTTDGKDTIIVKHEIKVIHVNGQSKQNRMHYNSSQKNHPPKKGGNGKIINTGARIHFEATRDKTGINTMTKTTEAFQITKNNHVEPPVKATDLNANVVLAHDAIFRTSDGETNENLTTLLWYGREISDLIAGSYVAIRTFLDNYEQWKDLRRVTMLLFEEFEKILSQSCNKNKRIIEVAEMVGTGCKMVRYAPHVGVSIAANIIAVISEIVSKMFSSSKSAKSVGLDDFQLRLCLQKDMDATSDIYLYGIQCDIQFQETCELIEKFYGEIQDGRFKGSMETFETGFLKKVSLLSPKHPEVFYRGLGRYYKQLHDLQQSDEGEAFCRSFVDWPDALTTVSRLYRRFRKENWDSSSVVKVWEEIYNLLQNDKSTVEEVQKKVQDCICMLTQEQIIMDKYVMDLQRQN